MKKILVVLSEYGYWGEELVAPLEVFDKMCYEADFATPKGKKPHALSTSYDANYIDPPLNKKVTTPEMAKAVFELDNSDLLDKPLSLEKLMPEYPYISSDNYLREFEKYNADLDAAAKKLSKYDALMLVGGSGVMIDMVNNFRVHDLVRIFVNADKPVAAQCYATTCLAFTRDNNSGDSLIKNKHVTGHPFQYDYKDGMGFYGVNLNIGPPLYPLESILRDATAPNGQFIGNVGKATSAVADYPFITGRSTPDAEMTAKLLVDVLEKGLKRYGW